MYEGTSSVPLLWNPAPSQTNTTCLESPCGEERFASRSFITSVFTSCVMRPSASRVTGCMVALMYAHAWSVCLTAVGRQTHWHPDRGQRSLLPDSSFVLEPYLNAARSPDSRSRLRCTTVPSPAPPSDWRQVHRRPALQDVPSSTEAPRRYDPAREHSVHSLPRPATGSICGWVQHSRLSRCFARARIAGLFGS